VIERIGELVGPDAIYVAGVGQHQMWASQFITYEKPGTWLNSGGAGTMGYAVPAAMGAKVGRPDTAVWAIDGDGCFQMTNQELATCALEGIPVKIAVINNGNLGMVRQWQTLFYEGRYSNTELGTHKHRIPDFVKLAEALGCIGLRCESKADVTRSSSRPWRSTTRPWSSTSRSARTPWSGRWSPPAPATTRSCSPGTCAQLRRGRPVMNKHTLSVLVENKPGVLARVSRPVLAAQLQHRLPGGGRDGEPGRLPHHDRGQRRLLTPGAGDQAAQQAGERPEDRRAGPAAVGPA
jgi:hypothetical protein